MLVSASVVLAVLIAGSGALDWWADASGDGLAVPPSPVPTTSPTPSPTPPPEPDSTPEAAETQPVLALAGEFPTDGPGQVTLAEGEGEVLGESGPLRRYRVAVEDNLDRELDEFAQFVDETLGDEQGWTAGGAHRFQRVPDGGGHEFTVYLVTSQTAGQMCAAGGLTVIAPGLPEGGVSCRLTGQVIINLSRWRSSVEHFVEAEVPLLAYRQMVLNHEVGHELGYGHYACPGEGEPAPVMQQQSIRLDGCEANPWPYLDGVHHTGPPAA